VIAHLHHFAAAAANGFHDDADEFSGMSITRRSTALQLLAILRAHHDFGLADNQFENPRGAMVSDQDG